MPPGVSALTALLAAVLDGKSSFADPHRLVSDADRAFFRTPLTAAESARYVVVNGRLAPDFTSALGRAEIIAGASATLLVEIDSVGRGPLALNIGRAGIRARRRLLVDGLHPDWIAAWLDRSCSPPRADLLLLDASRIAVIPRSTRIEMLTDECWTGPTRAGLAPLPNDRSPAASTSSRI